MISLIVDTITLNYWKRWHSIILDTISFDDRQRNAELALFKGHTDNNNIFGLCIVTPIDLRFVGS